VFTRGAARDRNFTHQVMKGGEPIRTSIISASSASARTAVSVAANCAALRPGCQRLLCESRGTISLSSPTGFPLNATTCAQDSAAGARIRVGDRDRLARAAGRCGRRCLRQENARTGGVLSRPEQIELSSDAGSAVLAFASSRPRGCGSRTSSWPARSLYQSDNPDQQARANEASNEVADPSP
jgi:hypothetical protein